MRQAQLKDIATLVKLMAEFYAESNYELDRPIAEQAFATLLADERPPNVTNELQSLAM